MLVVFFSSFIICRLKFHLYALSSLRACLDARACVVAGSSGDGDECRERSTGHIEINEVKTRIIQLCILLLLFSFVEPASILFVFVLIFYVICSYIYTYVLCHLKIGSKTTTATRFPFKNVKISFIMMN